MKIGILTYHAVSNFGANLQALSTIKYFQNRNIEVEIINWRPYDLETYYNKTVCQEQRKLHIDFGNRYFPMSPILRTYEDVENYIGSNQFDAILIGSDAVFSYKPILQRFYLSRKTLVKYLKPTSDHCYPNPFWGSRKYNSKIIALSACAQLLNIPKCFKFELNHLKKGLENFNLITVRDRWTKYLVEKLRPELTVDITPDPVFGLKVNLPEFKNKEVLQKFGISGKYAVISFCNKKYFPKDWFSELYSSLKENGYTVVNLAMPEGCIDASSDIKIDTPLTVEDWYNIIAHANAYIGMRMHPMIVAMTNNVPFQIFDHYTLKDNVTASKIYDLLERASLLDSYINVKNEAIKSPKSIISGIKNFNFKQLQKFVKDYEDHYNRLMINISDTIIN